MNRDSIRLAELKYATVDTSSGRPSRSEDRIEHALRALPSGSVRNAARRIYENEVPHSRITWDDVEHIVTFETDGVKIVVEDKSK